MVASGVRFATSASEWCSVTGSVGQAIKATPGTYQHSASKEARKVLARDSPRLHIARTQHS